MRLWVLLLVPVVCGCGSRDGEYGQACIEAADKLGIQHDWRGETSESGGAHFYQSGGLYCTFDAKGDLTSLFSKDGIDRTSQTGALVRDENRAMQIATDSLLTLGLSTEGKVRVRPTGPWSKLNSTVSVVFEPIAFGNETHGFAGMTEVVINRYTEKIVSLTLLTSRTPEEPKVMVSEAEACAIARQYRMKANLGEDQPVVRLQYFASIGFGATPVAFALEEDKRLRMCWVMDYTVQEIEPARFYVPRQPIIVAIDAETGEVLEAPL